MDALPEHGEPRGLDAVPERLTLGIQVEPETHPEHGGRSGEGVDLWSCKQPPLDAGQACLRQACRAGDGRLAEAELDARRPEVLDGGGEVGGEPSASGEDGLIAGGHDGMVRIEAYLRLCSGLLHDAYARSASWDGISIR